MKFEYTGRHVEVTGAIRKHVEDHFKKLAHIFDGTTAWAHVVIDVEKNRHIAELIVHWRDHTLTAKDINADMYLALTRAIAKIEKQSLKLKQKIVDRRQSARRTAAVAPTPDGQIKATPRPPRIIAARRTPRQFLAAALQFRTTGSKQRFLSKSSLLAVPSQEPSQ